MPWIFGSLFAVIGMGAVLLLGFVSPGWFVRTVFDAEAVQKGVQQVLRGSYKLGAVEMVRCPREVPVEPSHTFECEVRMGSAQQRTVTVTVKDSEGTYAVGYPR